VNLWIPEDKRN